MPNNTIGSSRNDFANERPAFPILPPALLRHVLFRIATVENPTFHLDPSVQAERWQKICDCLADHANAVRAAFDAKAPPIRIVIGQPAEADEESFSVHRTMLVAVPSGDLGFRMRIRLDVYVELFSITYMVDNIETGRENDLARRLAQLPGKPTGLGWFFDDFWRSFPAGAAVTNWTGLREEQRACSRTVGEPIADFRGIILCPRDDWRMDEPSLEIEDTVTPESDAASPAILAFAAQHQSLLRAVAVREGVEATRNGSEAVVCGMGGGMALYAASLGQWARQSGGIAPLNHLLVFAGHSDAQLGRLVRRMHVLGELRYAAVMDYHGAKGRDLHSASVQLRALGDDVDKATRKPSMKLLKRIVRSLADIGEVGQGGLNYRIEQSRYYADEYRNQLEQLRVVRIAGWQPYDDFVRRYISLLFGRIDRIGNRYEALGRRVDRLLLWEQAKGIQRYQKDVKRTLSHLDRLTTRQRRDWRRQLELLGNAELFAIIFGVYYLGSILERALFDRDHHWVMLGDWGHAEVNYARIWFAVAFLLTGLLVHGLFRARRTRIRQEKAMNAEDRLTD